MKTQSPAIETIIRMVAPTFGVTPLDVLSHRRDKQAVRARHVAIWLARRLTPHPLPLLGRLFDRDHTSVMHAISRIDAMLDTDAVLAQAVLGLIDSLTLPARAA